MNTTKNIWNNFLKNWMRIPADNLGTMKTAMKESLGNLAHIRATDINVHFGEG